MWGLFVKNHALSVSELHKVSVLYLETNDGITGETRFVEESSSPYTLTIYYSKPKCKILYFIKFIYLYFKGLKLIANKRGPIHLIHVNILTRMGFLAWLSFRLQKIPFVITEHWSRYQPNVNGYKGFFRKKITTMVARNAKAIMPVTLNLKNAMIDCGINSSNYIVVRNVVDQIFFNSAITPLRTEPARIIHVSTFEDRSKNISGIIDAVGELKNIRVDFKMVFVGDGVDFEAMKVKTIEKNLSEFIEFTGLLEKEALVHEFETASFLLINSNYENMPVVINEAFATGLPVLSTRVGGISEHVNADRGRLFEPGNREVLVNELNQMLDHFMDYHPEEIRKYAQEHFSMKAVGDQLSKIYELALKS